MALCPNCNGVIPVGVDYAGYSLGNLVNYCSKICIEQVSDQELTPSFEQSTPTMVVRKPREIVTNAAGLNPADVMLSTSDTLPGMVIIKNKGVADVVIVLRQTTAPHSPSGFRYQTLIKDSAHSKQLSQVKLEAIEELKLKAYAMGANCVSSIRIEIAQVSASEVSISAYGTASVAIEKKVLWLKKDQPS